MNGFCNDTGGGWPKFWDKKDGAAKKLTDDDRNAFAATDAEQIVMMIGYRCEMITNHDNDDPGDDVDDEVHMGEEVDCRWEGVPPMW